MTGTERVLVLTRHGVKPNKKADRIEGTSIENTYHNLRGELGDFVEGEGLTLQDAFLWRSDKDRTEQTGRAILAGAFGMPVPRRIAHLYGPHMDGLKVEKDMRLAYTDLAFNNRLVHTLSEADYLALWMQNPDAVTLEGEPITSFNALLGRSRGCLADALGRVIDGGESLGVLASHAPLVEAFMIAAVNSARSVPITRQEEIGGAFKMEDYAILHLVERISGGYSGRLERNGERYLVDVGALRGKA